MPPGPNASAAFKSADGQAASDDILISQSCPIWIKLKSSKIGNAASQNQAALHASRRRRSGSNQPAVRGRVTESEGAPPANLTGRSAQLQCPSTARLRRAGVDNM